MSSRLKDIFEASRATDASGKRRVLVALDVPEADAKTLDALRALGLDVEQVMGNKLVGTVAPAALASLRASHLVADVEETTTLKPHGD